MWGWNGCVSSRQLAAPPYEAGLTTLGWLLVVAAAASVAAVAVVLVVGVVGSSAQGVASHSARQDAAESAVETVERRWRSEAPVSAEDADRLNRLYAARCRRVGILYLDIPLEATSKAGVYSGSGRGWDVDGLPVCTLV